MKHTPETIQKMREHRRGNDLIEKFWNRVDKNGPVQHHVPHLGPCWEWTGRLATGKFRYGIFIVAGKELRAHRFAFELEHGQIPEGKCVLHACDNPKCVRHLFLGTKTENNSDRDRKRRQALGEKNSHAKLSAADADTLRWSYNIGGLTLSTLARWYGVSISTVWNIGHGNTWVALQAA
jgi:HNH endonuclease